MTSLSRLLPHLPESSQDGVIDVPGSGSAEETEVGYVQVALYSLSTALFLAGKPSGASEYRGCGVVDADVVLKESKVGKKAWAQIEAEFRAREEAIVPLTRARNSAERAWLDAKEGKQSEAQVAAARTALEKAAAEEAVLRRSYESDLSFWRVQEARRILDGATDVYQQLGKRERFAKLYQKGYGQPIITPEPAAQSFECKTKEDVTALLVREMDSRP